MDVESNCQFLIFIFSNIRQNQFLIFPVTKMKVLTIPAIINPTPIQYRSVEKDSVMTITNPIKNTIIEISIPTTDFSILLANLYSIYHLTIRIEHGFGSCRHSDVSE